MIEIKSWTSVHFKQEGGKVQYFLTFPLYIQKNRLISICKTKMTVDIMSVCLKIMLFFLIFIDDKQAVF